MARVASIKDFWEYAVMISALAESAGHSTFHGSPPVDFEQLVEFGPDVITLGLFRKRIAYNRPLRSDHDILGLDSSQEIESYPAVKVKPVLLLGNGIEEMEIPAWVHYDVFIFFPDDMHLFLEKVEELATKVKTRRKLSRYICPNCGSRLTFATDPTKDMFCPRCHTAVVLIQDEQRCSYQVGASGPSRYCLLDDITPRPGGACTEAQERRELRLRAREDGK